MTLLEAGWGLTLDAKGPTRWEQGASVSSPIVIESGAIVVRHGDDPAETAQLVAAGIREVIS